MRKFYVALAFEINALLYTSDVKTLIGVHLSAWAAAFAPSLLSDRPQVFNSSRAPTLNAARGFPRRLRPCHPRRRQALSAARAPRPLAASGPPKRGAARVRASTRARAPRVQPPERAPWRERRRPRPQTKQPVASPPLSLLRLWLRRLSVPPRPPPPWCPLKWAWGVCRRSATCLEELRDRDARALGVADGLHFFVQCGGLRVEPGSKNFL
jgi:hypothetical protein